MSALDRKLQYHEDRCKTQMTAAGRDMPCTCDRDDALAEPPALRERVEALEAENASLKNDGLCHCLITQTKVVTPGSLCPDCYLPYFKA